MFCPKCGSILMPQKVGGKKVMKCSCGYVKEGGEPLKITEEKGGHSLGELKVVDPEQEEKVLPLTDAECPECGHKKAYFWEVQTRASDEPATKFLKCEKCKHTWRDYS